MTPNASSVLSPLQIQRTDDIYINTDLQLNCNSSLSTINQWRIYNCTRNCSSTIPMGQTIVMTSSELNIPSRTLPYGTYQLNLTVSMVASPSLSSSASVYVQITPSSIAANLIQFGTSMITHGYKQDLLLDPGTFSVDPDATTFNASVCFNILITQLYFLTVSIR